jgi:hypothetical protein
MGNIGSFHKDWGGSNTTQVTIALWFSQKIICLQKIILQVLSIRLPPTIDLHHTKVEEERKCRKSYFVATKY